MSYTIQIWEKPADWPWPTTKAEADAQYERVEAGPQVPMNPKYAAWAQAVEPRFPGFWDIYLGGPDITDPTFGVGINTRFPDWGPPFDDGWEQAARLGLNLYDPQSGVHYLANGDAPEEPDLQVRHAARARQAGDDARAWAEYRRWAARGNPHALYALGRALRFGTMGQRRHFDLAAALQLMGAHDAETRKDAQAFYERFPDKAKVRIQALMARLKAAPGEPLLQIVDEERKAVDDAVARSEQLALYSRKRIEAADALEPAAAQGHEVAAFLQALETVIGWEQPNFENARSWCQRAADWDHEPAKRLLAVMFERGWGGPADAQQAAKWNAAAQEQRQRVQQKKQAQEASESPGGLSLAPMAAVASAPGAAAPLVWTGNPLRDLPAWYAREGDPHAAFHLGTSDEHGRYGSPVNLAQARAWYAQAAEAGHADATYNLGTFIERAERPQGRAGGQGAVHAGQHTGHHHAGGRPAHQATGARSHAGAGDGAARAGAAARRAARAWTRPESSGSGWGRRAGGGCSGSGGSVRRRVGAGRWRPTVARYSQAARATDSAFAGAQPIAQPHRPDASQRRGRRWRRGRCP